MTTGTHDTQTMPGPGEVIPIPTDFPVEWKRPGDERFFWQHDRMHFPHPFTPLTESLFGDVLFEHCWNFGGDAFDFPIHLVPMVQHGYAYAAVIPKGASPEEMEALGRKAEAAIGRIMPVQLERWNTELLPEIQQHIEALKQIELENASPESLRVYVDEAVERSRRIWEIHFLAVLPSLPPVSIFEDMYRDLFDGETAFDAYKLLQGQETKITETGIALWRLSRMALTMPDVRRVLEEEAPADVIPALQQTSGGQHFLAALDAYLQEYGKRSSSAFDVDEMSWIEDPTPAVKMLKDYVGQPDLDLEAQQDELVAERERATAEARGRLEGYPEQVRDQFEFLLDCARQGLFVAEEHNFHIDYNAMYHVRMVFGAVGRFLVHADRLADQEDVYYLTLDDIRAALDNLDGSDLRPIVAERRAERERRLHMHVPPVLGTMPPGGPPPTDPLSSTAIKFSGGPPQIATEPNTVQGTPGSPGVARGTARILHSLSDAAKLQKGDVIVAEATATPWTPLFATAAGIVTDTGGVLSHAAVAAREYGIPAVVGATVATTRVRDGQTIEIDGSTGVVRLLDAL
jgi:phosphohistidine swiveling domain-containing protein